jgi:hypothetical protein
MAVMALKASTLLQGRTHPAKRLRGSKGLLISVTPAVLPSAHGSAGAPQMTCLSGDKISGVTGQPGLLPFPFETSQALHPDSRL